MLATRMSRRGSTSLLTLRLLFVATMGAASLTLAWVGWAFLDQDAELSVQAAITHREAAADLVVSTIHNRLRSIEGELDRLLVPHGTPTSVPPGVLVAFRDVEVRTWPSQGLLHYPEHQAHPDSPQAVAVARAAVAHLSAGRRDEALRTYGDLSSLPGAYIVGVPAEVAGQLGALGVFERADDRVSIDRLASQLLRDTQDARWRLDGATYRYLTAELARLLKSQPDLEGNRVSTELWLAPAAGGAHQRVVSGRESPDQPAWSPDGRWLTYLSARGGAAQIYAWSPETNREVQRRSEDRRFWSRRPRSRPMAQASRTFSALAPVNWHLVAAEIAQADPWRDSGTRPAWRIFGPLSCR